MNADETESNINTTKHQGSLKSPLKTGGRMVQYEI